MTSVDSTSSSRLQSAASVSERSGSSLDSDGSDSTALHSEACSSQRPCDEAVNEIFFSISALPPLPDSEDEESIASLHEQDCIFSALPPLPDSDDEESIASLHENDCISSEFKPSFESDNRCEQNCIKSKPDICANPLEDLESCSPIDGTTEAFITRRASNDNLQSEFSNSLSESALDHHRDDSLNSETSGQNDHTVDASKRVTDLTLPNSCSPREINVNDGEQSVATKNSTYQFDMYPGRANITKPFTENPEKSPDEALSVRLEQANETIRHLLQSRDAMLSSVESLKILVSSERAVTVATKRKLAAAETRLHQEGKRHEEQTVASSFDFNEQLNELRQSKLSLESNLHQAQSLVRDKEEALQNMTETHSTAVLERDSALTKVSELCSRLTQNDERIESLSVQLCEESGKNEAALTELNSLHATLKNYDALVHERDDLQKQCGIFKEELSVHKNVVTEHEKDRESERLKNAAEIEQLQKRLQEAVAKVEEMQESVNQLDALKSQAAQFDLISGEETDVQVGGVNGSRALVSEADGDSQHYRSQLLCASLRTKERDEEILKLRGELEECRNNEREARSSSAATVDTLEKVRGVLEATQTKLSDTRNLVNVEHEARISAEQRVKELEEKIRDTEQNSAREREAASTFKLNADAEIDELKGLLDQANQKVSSLEKLASEKGSTSREVETSSPCSNEENAGERLLFAQTHYNKLSSLADLEEAANLSLSEIKESTSLGKKSVRSETDLQKATNRATSTDTETSQPPFESSDGKSIDSDAKIVALQEALEAMKRDLECKTNDYKAAKQHIQFNLSPALKSANGSLDETVSQLNQTRKQLKDSEVRAKNERRTLQNEVETISSQLKETSVSLKNSQNELKGSEENIRQLQARIQSLETEKAECSDVIADLQEECDRRCKSLAIIRDRLESVETRVGEYKQSVLDMELAKSEVEKTAQTEREGRFVAEQRVIQKDELLRQVETDYHKMAREKGDLEVHSEVLLGRIQELENQVSDSECALQEAMVSMQDQARHSRSRDKKSSHALKEMNVKLQEREQYLSKREHDLSCAQEKISKLSSDLAWSKEKLRSLENRVSTLSRDIEEKEELLSRKRSHIGQLEREVADLNANCANAEDEISQQRGELCRMRSTVDEKVDLVVNLTNENGELERRVEALENEVSSEKEQTLHSESLYLDTRKELSVVQSKLQKREEELQERINEAGLLKKLIENSRDAKDRAEKLIGEREHDLAQKQEHINELEDVLLSLKQELASLQSTTEESRALEKHADFKAVPGKKNLRAISSAKQQLVGLVGSLRSELASREQAEIELKKQICELEAEKDRIIQKLGVVCSETKKEKELLKERISRQESAAADKDFSIKELEKRIGTFDDYKAQSEEHLGQFQKRIEEAKSKVGAIEQKLSEEKDRVRAKSEELLQVETRLTNRDKEIFALEKELERLSKKSMEGKSDRRGSGVAEVKEESVERLREWCSFINRKLRVAEKESVEREAQLVKSGGAVKRLQSELTGMQDKLRRKESEIRKLNYMQELEVSQLKSRMDTLRALLGNMRASVPHSMNELMMSNDSAWFGLDTSCRDGSEEQRGRHTTAAGGGSLGGWPSKWDNAHSSLKQIAPRSQSATKLSTQLALAEYSSASQRGAHERAEGSLEQVCSVRFTLSGRESPAADVAVYVVGGDVTLGQWDASRRIALRVVYDDNRRSNGENVSNIAKDGVVRQCDVLVPASVVTWYKYVADANDGSILWERGENRLLCLDGQPFYTTSDVWRD